MRRRRWVRTRVRVALDGAGEAANEILGLHRRITALETVNRKFAEQVFKQQELVSQLEDRNNQLIQRLANIETGQSAAHGGTAFRRTIHGRGGVRSVRGGGGGAGGGAGAGAGGAASGAGGTGASKPRKATGRRSTAAPV